MDNSEKFQIYSECLKNIFEKIKKNLTKKHPYYTDLTNVCKDIHEKIMSDKGRDLNADKYFIYLKMALDGDNMKIIESVLENMQKLIKEDLLLGIGEDIQLPNDISTHPKKETHISNMHFNFKRRMIDSMIDSITKLFNNLTDENIWLNAVKILYTMYKNPKMKIHNDSLLKMYLTCIRIYLTSKTSVNIDTTKSSLNHMILHLFNRMEQTNISLLNRETTFKLSEIEDTLIMSNLQRAGNSKISLGSETNSLMSATSINKYYSGISYKNPVEEMINKVLKNMVDDVCLFYSKKDIIDMDEKHSLMDPPYKSVPPSSSSLTVSNSKYVTTLNPGIENEKGICSGNFGWCFICRNKSDLYCKDARYPVCSQECKLKIQAEDEKIVKYQNGDLINENDIALLYFSDCVNIFKSLCKMVNKSISSSNEAFNSKAKLISLELILSILDRPGTCFISQKEFIKIVKDDLMEGLLRNCVSDDINLFSLSLNVFFKIWHFFREHLKQQISVFLEAVFLKILDSGNSTFNHKYCVLDHFYKLSGTPKFYVELYVNYDCDINEKDLLNRTVISLGKIAQGKYAKSDHLLTPQQEYLLRSKALEIVTMMTRSLLMFTQDQGGFNLNKYIGVDEIQSKDESNVNPEDFSEDQASILDSTFEHKEKFDYNRKMKTDLATAVEKFNVKIKSGIIYLKKMGMVSKDNKEQEAMDLASFFKNSYGLKKEYIGEYLGENNEVALKTMHFYTQMFNFTGLHIIEAIRQYLAGFQLPGEGQKIDRIMEKFAAKYYADNVDTFDTADVAYYLAFSIIMLQTDTHNPQVKKKMGVEGFTKILKGINGGKDLDSNYIQDVYNQILNKPISLLEHEEAKDKLEASGNLKKKQDLFKKETERMYQEGTERLKKGRDKQYLKICEIEHIAPLMDSIWTPLLALFSLGIEDSEDVTLNCLCVEGIASCIKLCGMLNLDLQKEALLKGFCKLTNLLQGKEVRDKHIICIKSILQVANIEGRYLKGCWRNVLELISKIDYYHMVISGSKAELEAFFNEIKLKKKRESQNVEKEVLIERNNMERIAKEISPDDYEIIFNKTVYLDQESIVDFIKSLCEISRDELANKDAPRIFSLQKLVEVAEFNMNRVRIVWAKIWNIISEHLTEVGSNSSPVIAEKAVDSLRQLAKKFLQKDEISVYQFQKEFLKPFENILINNINVYRTKEYVITCIANLVLAEACSIKSGWRIIFNIFQLAAEDSSMDIIRKTFDTIVKIFTNHFAQVKDNFPELAHCLKKFSGNFPEEVINLYFQSAMGLEDQNHLYALLSSLASILSDNRENIRKVTCTTLFNLIAKIGKNNEINKDFWKQIFKVILSPVIDDLSAMNYSTTLECVLMEICDLFNNFYSKIDFLLSDFLNQLSNIISSENESTALTGVEALKYLINKLDKKDSTEFWEIISWTLGDVFNRTRQNELLNLDINHFNNPAYHQKYQDTVYKNIVFCIIQHNLIEICEYIVDNHLDKIRINDINYLLDCIRDSFELAYQFNIEFNLRKLISFHFMSDLNQIAALFKQQQDGTCLYYKILNKVFDSDFYQDDFKQISKKKLLIISHKILNQFVDRINFNEDGQYLVIENERLINNMVPVIIEYIIPSLIKIQFDSELEYFEDFTKIFIEIIPCNILEIRIKIKEILSSTFEKMIQLRK